jgi:hypothetical protein
MFLQVFEDILLPPEGEGPYNLLTGKSGIARLALGGFEMTW